MRLRLLPHALLWVAFGVLAASPAPAASRQVLRPEGFQPRFPYSPGIVAGDWVFLAGQGSRDPKTGRHPDSFEGQVRQAIENVRAVLQAGGMDLSHLTSCHVYLDDLENYARMNAVYRQVMTASPPVRTTIAVPALPDDSHIEITCLAVRETKMKQAVFRGSPPAKPGLFPPGMQAGPWLFTSGAGSRDPATGKHPEGFEAQVRQSLENLGAVLKSAGLGFSDVVWANVYLDDAQNLPTTEKVYAAYFPGPRKPGRTVSIVARIPGDSQVEITLLASREAARARSVAKGRAVLVGDLLFVSAQSAPGATIEDQVKGTFDRLKNILRSAGMGLSSVTKAHVYLKDLADFPRMNAVYRTYFPSDPPARTTVQVKQPGSNLNALVEISLVAVK